jgi:hypothetical protein
LGRIVIADRLRLAVDGSEMGLLTRGWKDPWVLPLTLPGGRLCWTDGQLLKVVRANTDGTGVETVADTSPYFPWGIAVLPGR